MRRKHKLTFRIPASRAALLFDCEILLCLPRWSLLHIDRRICKIVFGSWLCGGIFYVSFHSINPSLHPWFEHNQLLLGFSWDSWNVVDSSGTKLDGWSQFPAFWLSFGSYVSIWVPPAEREAAGVIPFSVEWFAGESLAVFLVAWVVVGVVGFTVACWLSSWLRDASGCWLSLRSHLSVCCPAKILWQ